MLILLTGPEHSGKTTACWKAIPRLRAAGLKVAGFISPPLLDETGTKVGIQMVDLLSGQHQVFARVVEEGEPATVGVYRLEPGAVEWARSILAAALRANVDWLVLDEIGPLELHHEGGFAFALEPLADPVRVPNAVVIVRESLAAELRERLGRTDIVEVHVSPEHRSHVPARLAKLIRSAQ